MLRTPGPVRCWSWRRETAADNVLAQRTLRDLTLLDGALARLALALQMTVIDYDTTPESGDDLTPAAAGALASSDPTPDPQRASG